MVILRWTICCSGCPRHIFVVGDADTRATCKDCHRYAAFVFAPLTHHATILPTISPYRQLAGVFGCMPVSFNPSKLPSIFLLFDRSSRITRIEDITLTTFTTDSLAVNIALRYGSAYYLLWKTFSMAPI